MAPTTVSLCELWLKLCLYVENFIKQALLNVLHNVNNKNTYKGLPSDSSRLYNELRNHHTKLTKLKDKKIINNDQWLLLFPANQQTDSTKFDPTLIVLLIINCTNLPPPSGGWKQKCPSTNDMSVGAFVLRAREFRNMIMHYSNPSTLTESEFTAIWLEGDHILNGLGYVIDTKTLKHDSLDPQRMDYFRLFLNHLQYGQSQLQRLVDENTTDVSNLSDLPREVIEMKENISGIKEDINKGFEEQEANQAFIVKRIDDVLAKHYQFNDKYSKEIEEMNQRIANIEEGYEDLKERVSQLEIGGTDEASIKHFWNVHQNVSNFNGREIVLDELYTKLNSPTNYSYSAVVLTGLGGIGKTETAARYAHIYGKEYYDNVFWIHADTLESSLSQLSFILNLDPRNRSIEVLLPVICNSLLNTKCLFVFDNVEGIESLQQVLTNLNLNQKPHIIVTSQFSQWSGLGIRQLEMDVFTPEEAVTFFQFVDNSENEAMRDLIAELQRLPLAMQQAVSYMKKHSVSAKVYLDAFRKNRTQLLNINLKKFGEAFYDKTLLTVWQMALKKLEVYKHEVAKDVINMMSLMDGNFINTKTFLFDENIEDEIDLNEIVEMLCEYSLISKKNSDVTQATVVTMHQLVQKVLKLYSEEEHSKKKSEVVQERLCNILVKASQTSFSWDNDEENIWFIHVKKLLKQGVILDIQMIYNVGFNRGEEKFCKEIFSLYLSQECNLEITDFFHFLKLNINLSYHFVDCNKENDAFDLMEKVLIRYNTELESKNSHVCYWKLNYSFLHLRRGDKEKGKSMYESVKGDIKSYKLDVDYVFLLKFEMQILYELKEFTAALSIINELEQIAEESNAVEKQHILEILTHKAHIYCHLRNIDRASSTVVEIQTHFKEMNIKQSNVLYIYHILLKARIFWIERNYEEALNVLTESNTIAKRYNLSHENVFILIYIGRVRIARGEYEIALKELNNAIDLCNESSRNRLCAACFLKGVTLLLLNKFPEAFKELSKQFSVVVLSRWSGKLVDCASKYCILLNFTKEGKEKYGVDSMKFKTMLTDCQNKKRELNKLIDKVNNNMEFQTIIRTTF